MNMAYAPFDKAAMNITQSIEPNISAIVCYDSGFIRIRVPFL